MTRSLYTHLAAENIRKNQKLYLPYLLTGVCIVLAFYIMGFLANSPQVDQVRGGGTLQGILKFGLYVMGIFSLLLLFYTSSFIIRKRRKEFGLYSVLGMARRHIARVMLWENLMAAGICIGGGLVSAVVLSKLAELGLLYSIGGEITFSFVIDWVRLLLTAVVFLAIYLLILLNSLRLVRTASPLELMRSGNTGEKEPKANFFVAVLGLVCLGTGYWLAVMVDDVESALAFFFVAVLLVIVGTYCCFISGSVVLLKFLRGCKKYYYRADHFISTSSMLYRMKRNGASLATICILSTMVLVMFSSVSCLLVGQEDVLRTRYPRHIVTTLFLDEGNVSESETLRTLTRDMLDADGVTAEDMFGYHYLSFRCKIDEGVLSASDNYGLHETEVIMIPLEDYNACTGANLTLQPGQLFAYSPDGVWKGDRITIDETDYQVSTLQNYAMPIGESVARITTSLYLLVPDLQTLQQFYNGQKDALQDRTIFCYMLGFDLPELDDDGQIAFYGQFKEQLHSAGLATNSESVAANREEFYSTFSGLFFLGVLLGIAFILAAVLIMYYKQVTEGYEDQSNFAIMMRIGLTRREIRKSVDVQVLTVFFLPLVAAGVHMAFAFPMVRILLLAFSLNNVRLFLIVTLIAYGIFAVLYTAVYAATSRAYYGIVSGGARGCAN